MNDTSAINVTASLNFDVLEKQSPVAAHLLRFFSFLSCDDIPWELPSQGSQELGTLISGQVRRGDVDAVRIALDEAADLALVSLNENDQTCSVHPNVQDLIRHHIPKEETNEWHERVLRALFRSLPLGDFSTTRERVERLLPHVRKARDLIVSHDVRPKESAWLMREIGFYLYECGHYAEAAEFSQLALTLSEALDGPDSPNVALALTRLGVIQHALKKYDSAERSYQRALEIRRLRDSESDPNVANLLINLGTCYERQGRLQSADECYSKAVETFESVSGKDDPETARALNHLASLRRDQGRPKEAQALYARSLAIYEDTYGPHDRRVGIVLRNLGRSHDIAGESAEARRHYFRAIRAFGKSYGPKHPHIATTMHFLADVLRRNNKLLRASQFASQALEMRRHFLGEDDDDFKETQALFRVITQQLAKT